ncbi:MAG: tetratricopeptide repeat protein [Candidatus Riflebacteria bacterium]|nr:tetratricopeptide repeat protein [Candidatus Riflebacteria bacterium]
MTRILRPHTHRIALFLFCIFALTPILWASSAKLHIDVGLNHFYKKRFLEAFREFKAAAEEDPRNAEAHYNMGRVYRLQGFLKEAVVEFQTAVTIDPTYSAARRELGEIGSQIEGDITTKLKIEGQEEALRQRIAEVGTNAAEKRGQILMQKGDLGRAITEFEAAVQSDPTNPKLNKVIGFLYYRTDKYADALGWYEKAEKFAPSDAEIPYDIGLIYLKTGDTERAIESFNASIRLSPELVKAQFGLGEAYEKLGRYEDAAFQYRKCLELNPNLGQAQDRVRDMAAHLGFTYFSRGSLYYSQGEYQKAEALLSLSRQYGSLTSQQHQQVEEMLTACRYWLGKQKAEAVIEAGRQQTRTESYINKNISFEDVIRNPNAYIGEAVEWEGKATFSDTSKGHTRYFINTNPSVDPKSNMDYTFGVVFPDSLPSDQRVSIYSQILVKGKILGIEKLLNTISSVQSSRQQPIIEAAEVTFTRKPYSDSLVIRY